MKSSRGIKKGDLLIVLSIVIIAVISLTWINFNSAKASSDSLVAVITRNGKIVDRIDLNKVKEPQQITYEDGIKLTVLAEQGRIKVLDADCEDKICVKFGWLTQPGDMAICLPSETFVKIEGEGKTIGLAKRIIID